MAGHTDCVPQWQVVGHVNELKNRQCRRLYTASGIDLALFCVKQEQFYITGAACPHARGPLDQGDIEDIGGDPHVVCPLHFYTFDLQTGQSSSGLKVDTFVTDVRDNQLYVLHSEAVSVKPLKKSPRSD
ncbi:hypothetical protein C0Q70_05344 [Pomacea canaliculata]|uniref:Rieske domain-containing protein n=1 Tax=Pomacea canaliculata TaxID=400727 RepID=A0A2T7PL08_POMCA|nr:Rieske domain-containing protein-like [Pomacea canaliculata]PVD34082.1 hypothetical protein C0Q70_05344 [Pomacea canaliculata]